jgi:metal-responsive CopG/Arc/MetJ family transcriptional regulator
MAKILVSLDERLLAKIDREARARGVSRSAYLASLASKDLGAKARADRAARKRTNRRLEELFARNPHPEDSTAAIRAERDAR